MSDTINYGIDLGTTNSAIAKYNGEDVRVFKNRDMMEVTPSVVRIEKTGRIIVGRRAYQTLFFDPQNVAAEFKRWMGQNNVMNFKAAGKSLTAEELSAEVLKSLTEDSRRQTEDNVSASVITVPAAFGQLQCEATARAAMLAGITEAPLLQEPLAASIAYRMKPDSQDKRWLIYDFGGGTFDIAVVSTRNGQLSILEHRGDNILGGKDLDRHILEKILWIRLQEMFNMPDESSDPVARKKLVQVLRGKAEEAKIDLSSSDKVIVSIFDAGVDQDGVDIEAEFEMSRDELNRLAEPVIDKTLKLCKEASVAARIDAKDISNIILVGGPTQMPIVREMLKSEFNVPLDFSIDPMTVVARGACIYASTLPLKQNAAVPKKKKALSIQLAHETVWSEKTCLVAGRIENVNKPIEIRIESESGHWNSGWLPIQKGYFEAIVHLLEGKLNRFWIYLRDVQGNDIPPEPDSFSIRHGLTIAEPPLPHSIGAEIIRSDGKTEIDVIFPRSTPLPTQKVVTYKAGKKLMPGQTNDYIAIKIWEGEYSDPESNMFVGALRIKASDINRPLPEGTDVEMSIEIDSSRRMKVQAYVPLLSQHFEADQVYIPENNEEDMIQKAHLVDNEIIEHEERLNQLDEFSYQLDDATVQQELNIIRDRLIELNSDYHSYKNTGLNDPDDSKRIVQQSKEIRGQLSQIDKSIKSNNRLLILIRKLDFEKNRTEQVINRWGTGIEKKTLEMMCREADRIVQREDEKAIEKMISDIEGEKWRILFKQDWYWKECFEYLRRPDAPYSDKNEAQRLIQAGMNAVKSGDADSLREIVLKLWAIQPKDAADTEKEMALEAGIKRR